MSARKTVPRRASAARIMALQAIMQIRERKAYAKQVVETMVEQSGLPEQERAFSPAFDQDVYEAISLQTCIDNRLTLGAPGDWKKRLAENRQED